MTSRERVLAAIDHQQPDRIPLDIWATEEVWAKLCARFGTDDRAAVRRDLHIDGFGSAGPDYIGPPLPEHSGGVTEDVWGMRYAPMGYATGSYMEQVFYPLAFARTVADLDAYQWPQADWFDYSGVRAQCEAQPDVAIMAGYTAPFYYFNKLRGQEQSLVDLALEPEFAAEIISRICDFFYSYHERLYEAGHGLIHVAQLTDDFGTQTGLMISQQMVEDFFMPHYRRFARLMRDHGLRIFHHDDGAMWELLPTLIDVGVDVLNPVQYRCGPVDLRWLKSEYGGQLCFHGGVDNQEVLPFGTVQDVIAETRKCIATLGAGGGYILAPCHNLQAVTPVENVIAMYDTAYNEGWY